MFQIDDVGGQRNERKVIFFYNNINKIKKFNIIIIIFIFIYIIILKIKKILRNG
jgi:hypothetical protein